MRYATVTDLMEMLDRSPVNFLATQYVTERLLAAGFTELDSALPYPQLEAGQGYFVRKNGSALFAFRKGRAPLAKPDSVW